MKHTVLFLIILSLFPLTTNAQHPRSMMRASIILNVKDSLTNTPLELVTAVLSKISTNNKEIFSYALSDSTGLIRFNLIPASVYEISLQYMGYYMKVIPSIKVDVKDLMNGDNIKDLGEVGLKENITELNAVTVKDHIVPIKYLGDTIQYNAAAFKLSDTDVLEDFFKKLPGWSVDNNGRITANGKEIKQITVNGRIFFLNDPVFVSRNLPAKLVKNLKLFEKQSEKAMFTGIDDGARTNTVDVAIKEDMLNGWLGNISAGAGTDERYASKGFVANFNKYNQVAIIGNLSNLNEPSVLSGTIPTNSGESRNYSLGSNLNLTGKKNKYDADISYKLKGALNVTESEVYRLNYIQDSSFVYDTRTKNDNNAIIHNITGIINRNNKKSMLIIKPTAIVSFGDYTNSTKYMTKGGESGIILNEGESIDAGKKEMESFSSNFQVITKRSKDRRTLSINGVLGFNRNIKDGRNRITNQSDQTYKIDNNSIDFSASISYTEPVSKRVILVTNYRLSTSLSFLNKETYNPDNNGNFINLDPVLSDRSDNTELRQNIELSLQKPKGKGESSYYMVGLSLLPSYLKRSSDGEDINRWFVNIAPKAEFRITTPGLFQFFVDYNANVKPPSLSLMMPVPDNTNPLYFRIGNKDLKSEYEHNISLMLRKILNLSGGYGSGIFFDTKASCFSSRIINKSWFDEKGVQYSMPLNDSGDYSLTANLMVDRPLFKGVLSFWNRTEAGYYNNISYVGGIRNITKRTILGESVRLTLNIGDLNLSTGVSFNCEKSENSIHPGTQNITWRNNIEASIRYLLPLGIDFRTNLSYQCFTGFRSQNDKPYLLWNADISKVAIRNKLIFSLSARDILNQNKNIQRIVSDFYIQETRYNAIKQYFLFSVTYKFFTGGKTGAFRERVNTIIRSQEKKLLNIEPE